jgi:MoxR-like ATPase
LAKTLVVSTLAQVVSLQFQRIQFTPDLLPSDLVGAKIYHPEKKSFSIHK